MQLVTSSIPSCTVGWMRLNKPATRAMLSVGGVTVRA